MELDKFYGRRSTLDLLKRRVLDLKEGYRQNIAFLGERYIGKSSILKKFIFDLDDTEIIPIYLDLENKDLDYVCYKYAGSILYNYSKAQRLPLHEDLNLLIESTQDRLPQTIRAIKKIQFYMSHGKIAEFYREIISLPQVFARESNKFCVLILDEFHDLEESAVSGIFQELGKRIMTQKRCLYVFASSLPGIARKILSEKLSLLFGNFEQVPIGPFDFKTSQGFIEYLLKDIKIGEPLRNFLIDFTGGHPLYLQLICQELLHLRAAHKQWEVFMPLLTQAIENVLFHPWGILSRHFDLIMTRMCSGKGNSLASSTLIVLSTGKQKVRELARRVGIPQGLMTTKVNRLVEMGVVVKNGSFYYLKDRLLKYWIKFIFQRRRQSVDFDLNKQKSRFHKELNRAIETLHKNQQKDLSSRIIELFHCFEDEAFLISGRRYKLPLCREIISKKRQKDFQGHFDTIRASTSQGDWFIVLKAETISEEDINAILTESRKMAQKPKKCILISLSNIDENAKVRALQERMWIWNEDELNTLLNLYDKPYIVH